MRPTRWCVIGLLATLAAGLPSPVGSPVARADVEPGSGLASYLLTANAPTLSISEDNDAATVHPEAEGELPHAVSTLGSTGGSYGLSSAVWPGVLAGNLGSLLIAASGEAVPHETSALNYPVRAEAKNNGGTVTNTTYPGLTLTASSLPTSSAAAAELTGAEAAGTVSVRNTRASSSTSLIGATSARATSTGSLQDLTIAGVVKLASVRSAASVRSDGVKADGTGSTTLQGATVAGVPVTIDDTGVHAAAAHEVVPGEAQQTVNTALSQIGMSVNVVGPTTMAKGGMVRYLAASFVFTWMPPPAPGRPDRHETIVLALGGAFAAAAASPGDVSSPGGVAPPVSPLPGEYVPPAGLGGAQGSGPEIATIPIPQLPTSQLPGAPVLAGQEGAAVGLPALPSGLALGWILGWMALASIFGLAVLRRLPTAFAASASTRCPREKSA